MNTGGIPGIAHLRISSGRRTSLDVGGSLLDRIHTHEVAGSSPAPPTNTNPSSSKMFRDSMTAGLTPHCPLLQPIEVVEGRPWRLVDSKVIGPRFVAQG